MKKIKILSFLIICAALLALTPVKINRITRQALNFGFYNEQAGLWKKETEKQPENAAAWQNYYLALRYANMLDPEGPKEERTKAMKEIIAAMQAHVPGTLEYYHCKVKDLNAAPGVATGSAAILPYIEKGLAIDPDDDELLESMIVYCEINARTEKLKEYYTRLYESDANPYPVMEYNYNVLMSVDKNAIVFTCGDNDSYPAWMLQQVKGIRTDVSVINISLAHDPAYLKRMLEQKNIVLPAAILDSSNKSSNDFIKALVLEIAKLHPEVPVFFALSCDVEGVFEDSLYCTGLAHKFSTRRMDNISELRSNVEAKFHLDYLDNSLLSYSPVSKELVENFNTNYTVPFAMLYRYYKNEGVSSPKMDFYKSYCLQYAAKKGKEAEMKEYLDGK